MESFNHILQMHLPTEWPRQPLQAEKMNLSFTPHTGLSSIKGRQSPIDHKQPFDFPSGLRNKSIWMGEASREKENKNRKQKKKKLALKEIRSPNNYKLTLVPTVYCWSTQIGIPLCPEPSPFPWGSGSWGKPLPRQYLYGDGEDSGNYECPREIPTPCEGSSAKNRESWHPLSWHWGRTICQTRWQTPGFRNPHSALPSGKLVVDEAHLVLRGGALCVFLGEGTEKPERRPAGLSYWFPHNKNENRGNKHPSFPHPPEPWSTAAIQSIPFRWRLWGSEWSPPTSRNSMNKVSRSGPFHKGVPNLQDLLPDALRSWCNNNRNKMHNKCNTLESCWNHPHPSPRPDSPTDPQKKSSSTKLVPGTKNVRLFFYNLWVFQLPKVELGGQDGRI